eukprot:scaffold651040_cov27-Prasinocladus_malaysianus.AAC.1
MSKTNAGSVPEGRPRRPGAASLDQNRQGGLLLGIDKGKAGDPPLAKHTELLRPCREDAARSSALAI